MVYAIPTGFCKVHFNIACPSTCSHPNGFWSCFSIIIVCAFLFSSIHATCPAYFILLDLSPYLQLVWQIREVFVMQFPPSSCYILPHSPKYLPQHVVLIFAGIFLCILGFWHQMSASFIHLTHAERVNLEHCGIIRFSFSYRR